MAGIGAYTPKPEWLLPVEQTDDQRKIKRLERDLEQVLSQTPKIVASIDDVDQTTREVRLFRPVAEPLGQAIVYDLASKVIENNPRTLLSTTKSQMMLGLGAISESDAERYNSSYETFQESVFMFYQNLHDCIARLGKAAKLSYLVRNESGIAAEGLRIEFDLEGEAWLLADRTDAKEYIGDIKLPQAPEAPRSRLDFTSYPISNIPTFRQAMEPRDPVGFYWFHRPGPGETHSALQCQDFRATREFRDEIFVLPTGELPVELRLRLHVSAANLPVPVNLSVKLVISDKHVQWSDIIVRDIFRLE